MFVLLVTMVIAAKGSDMTVVLFLISLFHKKKDRRIHFNRMMMVMRCIDDVLASVYTYLMCLKINTR